MDPILWIGIIIALVAGIGGGIAIYFYSSRGKRDE